MEGEGEGCWRAKEEGWLRRRGRGGGEGRVGVHDVRIRRIEKHV